MAPKVTHIDIGILTDEDVYVIAKKNYGVVIKSFIATCAKFKEGKLSKIELEKQKEEFLRRGSKYGSIIELYEKKHNLEPSVFHQKTVN